MYIKLIDANKLFYDMAIHIAGKVGRDFLDFGGELLAIVDEQPIIDPITHAQWVGEGGGYADGEIVYDVWRCSNCDYCIDDGTDRLEDLPNYCPECGAKMKEDTE